MLLRCVCLIGLASAVVGCSDWIMNDKYGLSVRTMDLGTGPKFSLKTVPKNTRPLGLLAPARYGHIISTETGMVLDQKRTGLPTDVAFAGLNEAGLSCDLHALLNSSYPRRSNSSHDLNLYAFCNWALANFGTAAEVRTALEAGQVHLWGFASMEADGVHFIVRDSLGLGLAVEFMEESVKLYNDGNDGTSGVGVFTNEPPFPWQVANVKHYLWKQSLARPATAVPGAFYPDERFLRIFLLKSAMPTPASYQEAVQHALHVLNSVTVPMGQQLGTDSGFGEGKADHTHYGHVYDHKNAILYWRHQSNLQLQRVKLADVLSSPKPVSLPLYNSLPFFHDAAGSFT